MNDDGSNLQAEPTATDATDALNPDDPVFELAGNMYDRLRADLSPEEAIRGALASVLSFVVTCGLADPKSTAWAWILEPIFELPVGWSTEGSDPEGAALARERFASDMHPAVVMIPDAETIFAVPVIGHDSDGVSVAGAMLAVPLLADVTPDDNVLAGVAAGGAILGVQLENSMRARAARRSLQFAQAASNTQHALVEPTDRSSALRVAIENLDACGALLWGVAYESIDGTDVELTSFGDRHAEPADELPGLDHAETEALRRESMIDLPITIEGVNEASLKIQSLHPLTAVERDTLASISAAVVGSTVRHRAAATIESLRRSATRQLVEAQERERSMVAADIHDGVLQQLGATAIRLELAQSRVELRDFETASAIIADGAKEIRSCARELRSLLMELRPQVLDDNGLNAALAELGRHVANTVVTVESDVPEDLGSEFAITIFRIVQEALTNIEKHAQAANATVSVRMERDTILIDVSDDGVGYEGAVTGPSAEGSHLGLLGMRERAQMFGGSFSISGASGGGTAIHAELPLDGLSNPAL